MANENWVEIKPKRRQRPNMRKPLQGNPKYSNASTTEKETKDKDQGLLKEEQPIKPSDALEPVKGYKELKSSKWDKQPAPSGTNIREAQFFVA